MNIYIYIFLYAYQSRSLKFLHERPQCYKSVLRTLALLMHMFLCMTLCMHRSLYVHTCVNRYIYRLKHILNAINRFPQTLMFLIINVYVLVFCEHSNQFLKQMLNTMNLFSKSSCS